MTHNRVIDRFNQKDKAITLCKSIAYGLLLMALTTFAAAEQEITKSVNIHAQSLSEALIEFSELFNRVVVGRPETLSGHTSTQTKGNYTAHEALIIMLSGTGLNIQKGINSGFIILEPPIKKIKQKEPWSIKDVSTTEEIFVLGRKNPRRPQNRVTSVTSFDNDIYLNNEISSLSQLSSTAQQFGSSPGNEGIIDLFVRGVSNFSGSISSFIVNTDGVYKPPSQASNLMLFDVDTIDMFKGPQITEPGISSVAGSLYLHSNKPELDNFESDFRLTLGSYSRERYDLSLNLPASENIAFRIAATRQLRDGYASLWDDYRPLYDEDTAPILFYPHYDTITDTNHRTSNGNSNKSVDNQDQYAYRASGLWQANNINWLSQFEHQHYENTGNVLLDPLIVENFNRVIVQDSPSFHIGDTKMLTSKLNISWNNIGIDYNVGWVRYNFSNKIDADWGRSGAFTEYRVKSRTEKSSNHNIEVFSLDENARLQWLAGIYLDDNFTRAFTEFDTYKQNDSEHIYFQFGNFFDSPFIRSRQQDIYTHLDYALSKKYSVVFGLRFLNFSQDIRDQRLSFCDINISDDLPPHIPTLNGARPGDIFTSDNLLAGGTINGNNQGIDPNQHCYISSINHGIEHTNEWTYLLGATYTPNNALTTFIKFGTGARPGIPQPIENTQPQHSSNFELGATQYLFNETLKLETALFYAEHTDIQVIGPRYENTIDDNTIDNFINNDVQNNANAISKGFELDIDYDSAYGPKVNFSFTYLDATFTDFDIPDGIFFNGDPWNEPASDPVLASLGYRSLSGNQLPNAPKLSASLSIEQRLSTDTGDWVPEIKLNASSEYYLDIQNREDVYVTDPHTNITYLVNDLSRQHGFYTADISLSWESRYQDLSFKLFAKNVTDEDIRESIAVGTFSSEGHPSIYSAPRTFGITFTIKK